jgi:uncharacterized protein YecE (DUF72 family)
MPSQSEFLARLSGFVNNLPAEFKYGIEIRNPNYLNDQYFNFLNEINIAYVFLQGYFMPDIVRIFQKYKAKIKNTTVIRLHGPDRNNIEKKSGGDWSKIIEPKDDDNSKISKIISELHSKNLEVYVNVNNHYEGSAPRTIERLKEYLKDN